MTPKNRNDKRARILRAAVTVFAKYGFYNSRITQIARQAGVADGTIYLYFKNKDELLISIFEEEMEKFTAEIKQKVNAAKDTTSRLSTFIHTHLQFVKQNPKLAHAR